MILLDTHVALWLYAHEFDRFSKRVQARLNSDDLAVSPVVELELAYLSEVGKIRYSPRDIIGELAGRLGAIVSDIPLSAICAAATTLTWTRDPFDRLLCAHAVASALPLITKDETIRRNLSLAWWVD